MREVAEELGLKAHYSEDRLDCFVFTTKGGQRFTRTELLRATPDQIRNTLRYGIERAHEG